MPLEDVELSILESDGGPETVLFLHGGGGTAERHWGRIATGWEYPSRLLMLDFRGHGESSLGTRPLSRDVLTDDLGRAIRGLGITSEFHIVAFSLGAGTALHYLLDGYWPSPASVTLVGSHSMLSREELDKGREGFRRYAGDPALKAMHQSITAGEWTTDEMIEQISATANDIEPSRLKGIKCRALVVHGDRDRLVSYRHAIELHEHIPNSQLLILPGAGHNAHLDRQAIFCAALETFMWDKDSHDRANTPASA